MKKNLLCVILCICILISILLGACAPAEPSAMGQTTSGTIPGEEINTTESSSAPGTENPPKSEKYVPWTGEEDFNALYASASEEKQKDLDAFKKMNEDYFFREREIKTIMGLLPDDTPRITLEQAMEIIQKHDTVVYENQKEYLEGIINELNVIHGYPDRVLDQSSSGAILEYHLDEYTSNQRYAIDVNTYAGIAEYVNGVTGERETIATYVDRRSPLDREWTWSDWDKYYEMATPEQRKKLDSLKAEEPDIQRGYLVQPRKVFIIMGILPEDTPRATLDQVKTILEKMKQTTYETKRLRYLDFQKRMNEVCGYYDYDPIVNDLYSTGIRYYLNDEGTERIWYRSDSRVEYHNEETGVKEVLVDFKAVE